MAKINEIIQKAQQAAFAFRKLDQKQTDRIVRAVYMAAMDNRVALAKLAAEETSLGIWQHKVRT